MAPQDISKHELENILLDLISKEKTLFIKDNRGTDIALVGMFNSKKLKPYDSIFVFKDLEDNIQDEAYNYRFDINRSTLFAIKDIFMHNIKNVKTKEELITNYNEIKKELEINKSYLETLEFIYINYFKKDKETFNETK